MKKALLIAEKPSAMKDIQAVYNKHRTKYGYDITFMSFVGHTLRNKLPNEYDEKYRKWSLEHLPIIPEEFEVVPIASTQTVLNQVLREINSNKYDYIINACDAAREGQLIFHLVYDYSKSETDILRFWTSDMSDKGIDKALSNLRSEKEDKLVALTKSSKLRSQFDWLLGMNMSMGASLKANNTTISIGRVMTPTLKLVVDRENDIKNFTPKSFFEIHGLFNRDTDFEALYLNSLKDSFYNTRFYNLEEAREKARDLSKESEGIVKKKSVELKKKSPYQLHSLTDLQREGNNVYGYTASEVLEIAQSLYEKHKLITYPRTDSRHLPNNMGADMPKMLEACLARNQDYDDIIQSILKDEDRIAKTSKNKRYVDDKKVSDHFAIVPTEKKGRVNLSKEESNIYNLILRRFIGIFLDDEVRENTKIVIDVNDNDFYISGYILKSQGFMVLYKSNSKDVILPDISEGDSLDLKNIRISRGETSPPKRYTDSSLLGAMSNVEKYIEGNEEVPPGLRIGTVATSAAILEKLIDKKMIRRKGKTIYPEEFGSMIIEAFGDFDFVSAMLTARWEQRLLDIENLELEVEDFKEDMHNYIDKTVKDLKAFSNLNKFSKFKNNSKWIDKSGPTEKITKCPKCKGNIVQNYNSYYCDKDCGIAIGRRIMKVEITIKDIEDLMSGNETEVKNFPEYSSILYLKKDFSLGFKKP